MTTLSATDTTPQTARPNRGLRWFKVGAWSWIATGTGHTLGDIATRISPVDSTIAVEDMMRATPFDLMGLHRTYYEVTMGFSLIMGTCIVFVGILFLWIARLTGGRGLRSTALLALPMSVVALALSAWLEPPPPIVLLTLACTGFALAARSAQPREAPTQPQP